MRSQHPSRPSPTDPLFIGLAGRIGAGKTSAAMHLSSKYGLQYTRYSHVLQQWLCPGAAADRDRLQKLGWDIMAGEMQLELNSRLIAGLDYTRGAAIDGMRHPEDFNSLSSTFGSAFRMVFLEAPEQMRFERLRARFPTHRAFRAAEGQPVEAYIDSLRTHASVTIVNDGSLADLRKRLESWLAGVGLGECE